MELRQREVVEVVLWEENIAPGGRILRWIILPFQPQEMPDFGNLIAFRYGSSGGCSSSTRGIFGGTTPNGTTDTNNIEYITISSTGNAFDFGDFTKVGLGRRSASNETRGIFFW